MVGPLIILKAYQLKKAFDRLKHAKENGLRIHHGLRPKYPWYEECWTWLVESSKNFCCRFFCPCCLSSHASKSDGMADNFLRRPCLPGSFENFMIKSLLGFLFGAAFTVAVFLFLIKQLNCDPRITTVICCFLGLFLTIGLAFSSQGRCLAMLTVPVLFSNRGRIALLAYAYILVMSGPTKNSIRNTNLLIESINCGQELIANQTKAILKEIFAPIIAIIDAIRTVIDALKDFGRQMKQAFLAVKDLFIEIFNSIKYMFSWILIIAKICGTRYGSPYGRCLKAFDDAIEDCKYRMGVFGFLCYIVTAISYICEIAKIVDVLCEIPRFIDREIFDPIKEEIKEFARYMYKQFYVNVTLFHYYNYSFDQSKSFEQIRIDITNEISERTDWFNRFIDWSDIAMTGFLVVIVFKSFIYRVRYLTADHFDNIYISYQVRDIDDRRLALEKETILPLSYREKRRYINTFSPRLGRKERSQLFVNLTVLMVTGIQMGFYMLLDYSLFHLLEMIKFHGKVKAKAGTPAHVAMSVKGDGVLADMYRQVITAFDPLMTKVPSFDTSICLPTAVPIDLDRYQQIGIMYGVCLLLTVTEAYGLRLRHIICSLFYPARERARAVWLYNHILKTRGGLLKFLRRQMRRKAQMDTTIEKISIIDRFANQSRMFARLLKAFGYVRIYCFCCSQSFKPEDSDSFKRCATNGCKGLYCNECFDDINNLCTLCMKPIEYGDYSDVSEERDSSDEELQEVAKATADDIVETEDDDEEDMAYQYEQRTSSSEREDEDEESQTGQIIQNRKNLATLSDFDNPKKKMTYNT